MMRTKQLQNEPVDILSPEQGLLASWGFNSQLQNYFHEQTPYFSTNHVFKLRQLIGLSTHPLAKFIESLLAKLENFVTIYTSLVYPVKYRVGTGIGVYPNLLSDFRNILDIVLAIAILRDHHQQNQNSNEFQFLTAAVTYFQGVIQTGFATMKDNRPQTHARLLKEIPGLKDVSITVASDSYDRLLKTIPELAALMSGAVASTNSKADLESRPYQLSK